MRFYAAQLAAHLALAERGICRLITLAAVVVLAATQVFAILQLPAWVTTPTYLVGMLSGLLLVMYHRDHPQSPDELAIQWRSSKHPSPPDVVDQDPR